MAMEKKRSPQHQRTIAAALVTTQTMFLLGKPLQDTEQEHSAGNDGSGIYGPLEGM